MADGAKTASLNRKVKLDLVDVKYSVKQKKSENKSILGGVSGSVKPGEMLCILGPSGSGKTSLIHVMSKKITTGTRRFIEGKVLCNGQELTASEFQRISGLVTQEDVFNAALTVQETLRFSAALKLKAGVRKERVDKVISDLQLEKCLKTYVGDDSNPYLKGISGGEKRRLAIALEIMDPDLSVLILDEPTSGLDAAAALNVTNLLRKLADTSMSVAATLHQPRSRIMQSFDKLMVIAAGRSVYYGGIPAYVPYLEADLRCEVPAHESPYDMFLDVLNPAIGLGSITMGAVPEDCADPATILADIFDQSSLGKDLKTDLAAGSDGEVVIGARSVGWFSSFLTILHRTFVIKMRDPIVLATQVSSAIMLGVVFGIIYFQVYDKAQQYVILDAQMAVTMTVIMAVFLPYDVTLTFPTERKIFLRERKAGLYSTSQFFCARILSDMPMHVLAGSILGLITYPMVGLEGGLHFWLLTIVVSILAGAALMQMVGALSRTFQEANLLMMLILMLSQLLSTGFVRDPPKFLLWLRDISVMGIAADIAMYFEFRDIDPKFGEAQTVFSSYAVRVRTDDQLRTAFLVLLAIVIVARVVTYLAVKFLFTGRDFNENLRD